MEKSTALPKLVMIGGPTAVGKSALAVTLAQRFDGEVINGDAYQIYRGMDIGTAKVTEAEMAGVPHHLLDLVDPGTPYSAAQFKQAAQAAIAAIRGRGKLPIVVGGTGFYLNALRLDLPLGTAPPSPARMIWQAKLAAHDAEWLWTQLHAVDPAGAAKIPAGNTRRVIRALEVWDQTGRPISAQPAPKPAYDALVIGLTTDRSVLYDRINRRVDQMVAAGLVPEVQGLVAQYGANAQAMQAIGYKELVPYLAGQEPLAAAVGRIKQSSRHYAKRQLTYFRHQLPTEWYDLVADPAAIDRVEARVTAWLGEENELAR